MAGRERSGNLSGEQGGRTGDATTARRKERRLKPVLRRESRKLERAVGRKNEKLRGKYRAVHGKVVDWVDHAIEDGNLFVSIRFQDKTDFSLQFSAKIVADEIDLCEVRSGNLRLLRQYFRRRD